MKSRNFFTEELIDLASIDYESKGSKRLRSSRTLAENERLVIKFGSGQYLHVGDASYLLTVDISNRQENQFLTGDVLQQ